MTDEFVFKGFESKIAPKKFAAIMPSWEDLLRGLSVGDLHLHEASDVNVTAIQTSDETTLVGLLDSEYQKLQAMTSDEEKSRYIDGHEMLRLAIAMGRLVVTERNKS
jgi:hypothetical protein